MILSRTRQTFAFLVAALLLALAVLIAPQPVSAQAAPGAEPTVAADAPVASDPAAVAPVAGDAAAGAEAGAEAAAPAAGGYTPLGVDMIKGQPVDRGLDVQPQYSEIGQQAVGLHIGLVWVMVAISVFVLGLLLWVIIRYNRRANPVPSRTTHNTTIEVVWTLLPVVILVAIALPSISLLAKQYESPPKDAITIKVTGYQWYWGYNFPDNGDFEIVSNMLPEADAIARGEPAQLAVDNRLVVPVNTPLRIQTTAADVIHSFAVPSLWFKIDAVPGRLNERLLTITEPGIYYGQCSELCGVRHGYMPIAVEAVPRAQWEAWVLAQGGTLGDDEPITPAASAATTDAPASGGDTAAASAPAPVEAAS